MQQEFKIKIEKLRDERLATLSTQSKLTTSYIRQITMAGIAVVWMLLTQTKGAQTNNHNSILYTSLFLLCLSLFFEILQYGFSMVIYLIYATIRLKKLDKNGEITQTEIGWDTMWLPWLCFGLKILISIAGFVLLGIEIFKM